MRAQAAPRSPQWPEHESKAIRRVRTPAGAAHFGQPIGTIIVADLPMPHVGGISASRDGSQSIEHVENTPISASAGDSDLAMAAPQIRRAFTRSAKKVESEYSGWDKYEDDKGRQYYIGKDEETGRWLLTDEKDNVLQEHRVRARLLELILPKGGKSSSRSANSPAPRKRTPVKKPAGGVRKRTADPLHEATQEEIESFNAKVKAKEIPANKLIPNTERNSWTEVFIADHLEKAGMLAKGRNKQGTWQYVYRADLLKENDEAKWKRIILVGKNIGKVDKALEEEAGKDDTATVALLMRRMAFRVSKKGGEFENAKGERVETFGATSLQARHVRLLKNGVTSFDFIGKKQVRQRHKTDDPLIYAAMERALEGKSGRDYLFDTDDQKTAAWLREKSGINMTNHDLRTHYATVMARKLVQKWKRNPPTNKTEFRRMRKEIGTAVSEKLGNTATEALNAYISPAVFADYVQEGWQ